MDLLEHGEHLLTLLFPSKVPLLVDFDQVCFDFVHQDVLLRHSIGHYHQIVEKVLELLSIQVRRQVLLLLLSFLLSFFPFIFSLLFTQLLQLLGGLSVVVAFGSGGLGCEVLDDIFEVGLAPLFFHIQPNDENGVFELSCELPAVHLFFIIVNQLPSLIVHFEVLVRIRALNDIINGWLLPIPTNQPGLVGIHDLIQGYMFAP